LSENTSPPQRLERLERTWESLARWWQAPNWHKVVILAVVPFLCLCACCSLLVVISATPYGQQLQRQADATDTASATANGQAIATATAYALLQPTPTATPTIPSSPTVKPLITATPAPLVLGATLGGPTAAFCAKYGAYDVNPGTFAACSLFDVNGLSISLNDDTGVDGKPHVFEMMERVEKCHSAPLGS
jgi:hypothetical protein